MKMVMIVQKVFESTALCAIRKGLKAHNSDFHLKDDLLSSFRPEKYHHVHSNFSIFIHKNKILSLKGNANTEFSVIVQNTVAQKLLIIQVGA